MHLWHALALSLFRNALALMKLLLAWWLTGLALVCALALGPSRFPFLSSRDGLEPG